MKTSLLVLVVAAFVIFAISDLQIQAIRVSDFEHKMKPKRHLSELLAKSDAAPHHERVAIPGHPPIVNNKDDGKTPQVADHKNGDDDDVNESYGQYGSDDSSSESHHYYYASKHSGKDETAPAN